MAIHHGTNRRARKASTLHNTTKLTYRTRLRTPGQARSFEARGRRATYDTHRDSVRVSRTRTRTTSPAADQATCATTERTTLNRTYVRLSRYDIAPPLPSPRDRPRRKTGCIARIGNSQLVEVVVRRHRPPVRPTPSLLSSFTCQLSTLAPIRAARNSLRLPRPP